MTARNPWRGLSAYSEPKATDEYRYRFCGRERATGELTALIKNNLFTTLYGRTGIGKTSLLEAGVFPELRKSGYLPVVVRFAALAADSGTTFAAYIVRCIESVPGITIRTECNPELAPVVRDPETGENQICKEYLWAYFATRRFYVDGKEVYPTIVLDQFEENFIARETQASDLLEQLYSLTDDNKIYPEHYHDKTIFRIVVSIREDDLYRLEDSIEKRKLFDLKFNRYRLVQLTDAEASAIVAVPGDNYLPADEAERRTVVEEIIRTVKAGNDGNLHTLVLSLICSMLFDATMRKGKPCITLEEVGRLGTNPLTDFYLSLPLKKKVRVFLEDRLVDAGGRRNAVNREELDDRFPDWPAYTVGTNRILQTTDGKVELVHDLLAKAMYDVKLRREKKSKKRTLQYAIGVLLLLLFFSTLFCSLYDVTGKDLDRKPLFVRSEKIIGDEVRDDHSAKSFLWDGTGSLSIRNCMSLELLVVENTYTGSISISDCPYLTSIVFQGDADDIFIGNCPRLKVLNIPAKVGFIRTFGTTQLEKIVPQPGSRYRWLDGVLWELPEKGRILIRYLPEGKKEACFPYELRDSVVFANPYYFYKGDTVINSGRWIDGLLFDRSRSTLIGYRTPTDSVLDLTRYENLKTVAADALDGNDCLRKVIRKPQVDYGENAFAHCPNLDTIDARFDLNFDIYDGSLGYSDRKYVYLLSDSASAECRKTAEGIVMKAGLPYGLSAEYPEECYIKRWGSDSLIMLSHGYYLLVRTVQTGKKVFLRGKQLGTLYRPEVMQQLPPELNPVFRSEELDGNRFLILSSSDAAILYAGESVRVPASVSSLDGSHITSRTREIVVGPKFKRFVNLPDSLRRNIVLYFPYGLKDKMLYSKTYYNRTDSFYGFRVLKELDGWTACRYTVLNAVDDVWWNFTYKPYLLYAALLLIGGVGLFFSILWMAKHAQGGGSKRSIRLKGFVFGVGCMLALTVIWTVAYWFIWYVFNSRSSWVCSTIALLFTVAVVAAFNYNLLFVVSKVSWRTGFLRGWTRLKRNPVWAISAAGVCLTVLWGADYRERVRYGRQVIEVAGQLYDSEKALLILTDYIDRHARIPERIRVQADSVRRSWFDRLGYNRTDIAAGRFEWIVPSADGRSLLSVDDKWKQNLVRVWDIADQRCIDTLTLLEGRNIRLVAIHPEQSVSAFADWGNLYIQRFGDTIARPLGETGGAIRALTFDRTGGTLACSRGGTIELWNRDDLRKTVLEERIGGANDLCFSSERNDLFACSSDGSVVQWTYRDRRWPMATLRTKIDEPLRTIAVDRAGDRVAVAGDSTLYLHRSGDTVRQIVTRGALIRDLCFSPDDRHLAVCYADSVAVWAVAQHPASAVKTIACSGITSVCFGLDGNYLFGSGSFGIRQWNLFDDDALSEVCRQRLSGKSLTDSDRRTWGLK